MINEGRAPQAWPDGRTITDVELRPHVTLDRVIWRGGFA